MSWEYEYGQNQIQKENKVKLGENLVPTFKRMFGKHNEIDISFSDAKLSETLNLRVTKAVYFTIKKVAEMHNVPMSEYARFLIGWHMSPAIIRANLFFGEYSPDEAEESVAEAEERLDSLLSDLDDMKKIHHWAVRLKEQFAELREEIKTGLSGAIVTEYQDILKTVEKTNKDFIDTYFEMTEKRRMSKKSKK